MEEKTLWLFDWFGKKKPFLKDKRIEEYLDVNYFEAGLIDSLGIYELILDIEAEYNVKFSEMDFRDRRFSTITGLAEIITELAKSQEG